MSHDAESTAEFHQILRQLITHCTPFSFFWFSQQQHASPLLSLLLFCNTTPPCPKSPAGGLAWSQHNLSTHTALNTENTQKSKCVCVNTMYYMCVCVFVYASESVPNEFFTGSSTSGHSSTPEETGSMWFCVCTCLHECMVVCLYRGRNTRWQIVVFIQLSVLGQKLSMTSQYWDQFSVTLQQLSWIQNNAQLILMLKYQHTAQSATTHYAKPQLSLFL